MEPNLYQGDLAFVFKSAFNIRLPFSEYELFRIRRPRAGEVVAFSLPDSGETVVKRVIAVEGDELMIDSRGVTVNKHTSIYDVSGDHWVKEYLADGLSYPIRWTSSHIKTYGPVIVPAGHFFALGDNREDSVDSRNWGTVPFFCLKGKPEWVGLSVGESGLRSGRFAKAIP